jgi:SAM-dependent methyltransferase
MRALFRGRVNTRRRGHEGRSTTGCQATDTYGQVVSFDVSADAYGRFMGRYSRPLAAALLDHLGPRIGRPVLDVGCGPGALTEALVERAPIGASGIHAVDPSVQFVRAVDVLPVTAVVAVAERLPFADGVFDAALAQLVVHLMADPVAGLREMARVTAPGGLVAASVWDHAGDGGPLSTFWRAARNLDPTAPDESTLPGVARGQLQELAATAGWAGVVASVLAVDVVHPGFDEWWEPFMLGVGPAGAYVAGLSDAARGELRAHCRDLLPEESFVVPAKAWLVVGSSPRR